MCRFSSKTVSKITFAALVVMSGGTAASAGGGFSASSTVSSFAPWPAATNANQSQQTDVSGQYGNYSSGLAAHADTAVNPDGTNHAGVGTSYLSAGGANGTYSQQSTSTALSVTKGANVIARGRTETYTTIIVNGKQYIVVDEIARALARITDLGTSSTASVDVNVFTGGNGYGAPTVNTHSTQRAR